MIRHVVLFRWVAGVDESSIAAVEQGLAALPGLIEEIVDYRFGPDAGINDNEWDYAVVADFASAADYMAYRDHPEHRSLIEAHIAPVLAARAAVQIDLAA